MNKGLFTDLLVIAGLAMLFYGLWLRAPWLAWSVVGALVIVLGVLLIVTKDQS